MPLILGHQPLEMQIDVPDVRVTPSKREYPAEITFRPLSGRPLTAWRRPAPRVVATSRRVWRRTGRLATVEGMTLRFHDDGTFRVLQMADIQDGPEVSATRSA